MGSVPAPALAALKNTTGLRDCDNSRQVRMTITLRPENEKLIAKAMQTGAYQSPDEVIRARFGHAALRTGVPTWKDARRHGFVSGTDDAAAFLKSGVTVADDRLELANRIEGELSPPAHGLMPPSRVF